jgi:hypothetical protein
MADYLSPFIEELRAQVLAAWPEVGATGVPDAEHAALIAWQDLTPPYAVILVPEAPGAEDWGLTTDSDELQIEIYRVDLVSGDSAGSRAALTKLQQALWPNDPLTLGMLTAKPKKSWSGRLAPNRLFMQEQPRRRAGCLTVPCLVEAV